MRGASKLAKTSGIALIVVVGLLNLHIPHFLLEPPRNSSYATYLLELGLLANVLGAVIAGLGIYLGRRWGWLLGAVIATVSVAFYVVQETVGLPELPKMWLEPSRLLALLVEGLFLALVGRQMSMLSRSVSGR